LQYIKGLLVCERGKANMERMEEEVPESEYRAYQQFISNSRWDYSGANRKVASETSFILAKHKRHSGCLTGFIIDESAHLKKGEHSVGVARQYAGIVAKITNCQVGVYSSLVNDRYATLIGQRLFLPNQQYAYFQSQRYWVERCFEDAKNELGLSDYQVRKLMIVKIFGNEDDFKRRLDQMAIRHQKRQANIDRHYRDGYKI